MEGFKNLVNTSEEYIHSAERVAEMIHGGKVLICRKFKLQ